MPLVTIYLTDDEHMKLSAMSEVLGRSVENLAEAAVQNAIIDAMAILPRKQEAAPSAD